jgi:lauroyl/myristoyl acyltransferase
MKKGNARLLKRLQWRVESFSFLAVERLLNLIPLETLWNAGAALSGLARLFASRWPTVRNNLRTVLGPGASEAEIADLTREVFRHTAANLLTSLKGAHVPPEKIREALVLVNKEASERAYAKGKGIGRTEKSSTPHQSLTHRVRLSPAVPSYFRFFHTRST